MKTLVRARLGALPGMAVICLCLLACDAGVGRPPTGAPSPSHLTEPTAYATATTASGSWTPRSPTPSVTADTECRLVDGGTISGRVTYQGQPVPDGVWVHMQYRGGPTLMVRTSGGEYRLRTLARQCVDGFDWIPFSLRAGRYGPGAEPAGPDYRLDIEAAAPLQPAPAEIPGCELALGRVTGRIRVGESPAPDGTIVQVQLTPGVEDPWFSQRVLTEEGRYTLASVAVRYGDGEPLFETLKVSVLGTIVSFAPKDDDSRLDITLPACALTR